ncbi:Lrp/AsnC family transcriptional regulator [Pseudomonas sp. GD03860]|uniref:Lrp/AsnC family transcriptional regulator n=1 Tax=Pseudomonas TaxID=286 RepID=UPI00236347AB|nr:MULTISPECIES: Lrp/AsnC family transcriptional regulator [Pseudomonas]MDD2058055.1 Lrp/AsnC family transcriptional regulator [Pseudomonas putida]MDH0639512.1 Lrp/AsnC family transcriptional regulator [Pseudomonas sp. GD03860]
MDKRLLTELQTDARLSFAELGRRAGLSTPATAERVRKLEERGVLRGYRAEIDSHAIGYPVTAFIRLHVPAQSYAKVLAVLENLPEVREAHHVTGDASFVLKVVAQSLMALETLIASFDAFGSTETSVVLSTRLAVRGLPIEV